MAAFHRAPPLTVVAPFFLAAPFGLLAAGLLASRAGSEVFVAINTPRLVAITHAIVLGWITSTMMGATYQLGPVVLGGEMLSTRLARVQFVIHAAAVATFVWVVFDWNVTAMSAAGVLLILSLVLYVINAGRAVARADTWSLPRMYIAASLVFLVIAGAFGLTWVGSLEHGWFPITMGRLAAHAHIGLVGWLALTLMGVSYQLVPMFNIAMSTQPRFGCLALAITAGATVLFAGAMLADPPMPVRVVLAAGLAAGPLVWSVDQWRLLRGRVRRKFDIQGRATVASLVFLVVTVALGIGAAIGTPLTPDSEPARWPLAYGAAATVGWAGLAIIGNGVKIMAFLVWINRYQSRAGTAPIPMVGDLYSARLANSVLGVQVAAASLLVLAALAGSLALLHFGALVLALSAAMFIVCLGSMFVPRGAPTPTASTEGVRT